MIARVGGSEGARLVRAVLAVSAIATLGCASSRFTGPVALGTSRPADRQGLRALVLPGGKTFRHPVPRRSTLECGAPVFLLEDPELPLVEVEFRFPGGSSLDPPGLLGLAEVAAAALRTGGTSRRAPDEIDALLDRRAASIEARVDREGVSVSLACLSRDLSEMLGLLAEVLRQPAFRTDRLEAAVLDVRTRVRRRNESGSEIADREFRRLVFGAEHPLARVPEFATVEAIDLAECERWHARTIRPDHARIGAWGDFDSKSLVESLDETLREWAPSGEPTPPELSMPARSAGGLWVGRKEDLPRTSLRVGHLGDLRLDDPDFPAVVLADHVLGSTGLGTSRLEAEARAPGGPAFSVRSRYDADYAHPGLFEIAIETSHESAGDALSRVLSQLERLRRDGPTDEEVVAAKDAWVGSFAFRFDDAGEIVRRAIDYDVHGYPPDTLETLRRGLEAVGRLQVHRAAQVYFQPDRIVVLAVGAPDRSSLSLERAASRLGPARTIDLSIPPPPRPSPSDLAFTPEARERGAGLLRAWVEASGGHPAVAALRDAAFSGEALLAYEGDSGSDDTFLASVRREYVVPDRCRQILDGPTGRIVQVWGPDASWIESPSGTIELPESGRADDRKDLLRNLIPMLASAAAGGLTAIPVGRETLDERPVTFLRVEGSDGTLADLGLDEETLLIAAVRSRDDRLGTGPAAEETLYGDYRRVGSLLLPHRITVFSGGMAVLDLSRIEWQVNAGVEEDAFRRGGESADRP